MADLVGGGRSKVSNVRLVEPASSADDVVMRGRIAQVRLREGLFLHWTDAIEMQDLAFQSVQSPGITAVLFLSGGADVVIGDRDVGFGTHDADRGSSDLKGVVYSQAHSDGFTRHTARGERVRKVVVTMQPEWLATGGLTEIPGYGAVDGFLKRSGEMIGWKPSAHLIRAVEQILNPVPYGPGLLPLYLESRAVEIAAESLEAITSEQLPAERRAIGARDHQRLSRIMDYIEAHIEQPLELTAIAREVGLSVNTLQRLFRAAHDTTVLNYVRARKLDRAHDALRREGLSVAEAAFIAGYSNAANFVTAFKRAFGGTPGQARGRR